MVINLYQLKQKFHSYMTSADLGPQTQLETQILNAPKHALSRSTCAFQTLVDTRPVLLFFLLFLLVFDFETVSCYVTLADP